ncbi:helix-turn-helix transcriptional regulator [Nocardioides terrisoli]|uniref:helix-turn-helix transcriptional regulator n=1 Tax=Nocardioides terrisoli TaxID=3388267 RepID=UPI00287BBD80|nr:helix-turn-helix domain-containing protein [Nocardioides marmorisolisilvae]
MENRTPDLGPLPATPTVTGLSRGRRTVLDLLGARPEPTTLADLAELAGLHENTVRGHLDALADDGLVTRVRAEPEGRGRPAWLWSASGAGTDHPEYAGLATALARTLLRTSAHPEDDAVEAGQVWGRELASASTATSEGTPPRQRVRRLLADLGFAPEPGRSASGMRLTRCPLLELAREQPGIVCNVHLGLVGGALEEYGATDLDAELRPFAEPGACLLDLRDQP